MSFTLLRLLMSRVVHHHVSNAPLQFQYIVTRWWFHLKKNINAKVEEMQSNLSIFVKWGGEASAKVSIVRCWSIHRLNRPLAEFHRSALLSVLWKVPEMIAHNCWDRYMVDQVGKIICRPNEWWSWVKVLSYPQLKTLIDQVLDETAKFISGRADPEWSKDHYVCSFIFSHAAHSAFHVNDHSG